MAQRRQQIGEFALPVLTQEQVRRQTQQSIIQREQQQKQLQQFQRQQLQKLQPFQTQITQAQEQLQKQSAFSSQVRAGFARILQGKPVDPTTSGQARTQIQKILDSDPALKSRLAGGLPSGLSEARKTFLIKSGNGLDEKTSALQKIVSAQISKMPSLDTIEIGGQTFSVAPALQEKFVRTFQAPTITSPDLDLEQFELRQTGQFKGIPTTSFFSLTTGKEATRKQQTELRKLQVEQREVETGKGFRFRDIEFKEFLFPTQTFKDPKTGETFFRDPDTGELKPFVDKSVQQFVENKLTDFFNTASEKSIELASPILPDSVEDLALTKFGGFQFTDQLKFLFFAPAITTAGVKTGKAKAVVKQKIKPKITKKVEIKSVTKGFENEFRKGNLDVINQRLRDLSKVVQSQKDLGKKEIAIVNLQKILRDLNQKGIIRGFAIDEKTGLFNVNLRATRVDVKPPTITIDISEFAKVGRLEQIGKLLTGVKTGEGISTGRAKENERVRQAREKNRQRIENSRKTIGERVSPTAKPFISTGIKPSIYSGLGLYERSEQSLVRKLGELKERIVSTDNNFLKASLVNRQDLINRSRLTNVSNAVRQLSLQLLRQGALSDSLTRQINATANATTQANKTNQLSRQRLIQSNLTTQLSQLKLQQKLLQKKVGKGALRIRLRLLPRVKPPILLMARSI